MYDGHLINTTC